MFDMIDNELRIGTDSPHPLYYKTIIKLLMRVSDFVQHQYDLNLVLWLLFFLKKSLRWMQHHTPHAC